MVGLIDLVFFGTIGVLIVLDFILPARKFPAVSLWRVKGIIAIALYYFIATWSPILWDEWLGQYRLIDGTDWPIWVSAPLALVAYQVSIYVWHRTMHATPFLWRHFHQTHHSAERIDIWGALYFHPLDVLGFAFVGSLALTLVLGVEPAAIIFAFVVSTFTALFQHANLKTPKWLGYIIVRPESHALHHERGVHRYNYCDLPIIDMVFGTFRNPEVWEGEAGLVDGGSSKYASLLIGRDITKQPSQEENGRGNVTAVLSFIGALLLTGSLVGGVVLTSIAQLHGGPYFA